MYLLNILPLSPFAHTSLKKSLQDEDQNRSCAKSFFLAYRYISYPMSDLVHMYFFFHSQDEESDPLLSSFSQLKDILNNISGMVLISYLFLFTWNSHIHVHIYNFFFIKERFQVFVYKLVVINEIKEIDDRFSC